MYPPTTTASTMPRVTMTRRDRVMRSGLRAAEPLGSVMGNLARIPESRLRVLPGHDRVEAVEPAIRDSPHDRSRAEVDLEDATVPGQREQPTFIGRHRQGRD